MNIFKKILGKIARRVTDKVMGSGLMQEENSAVGERYITPGISEIVRQMAAESCVLLKNDNCLPLNESSEIAVFGRCQYDWFFVGYGSGGDVHPPYTVNLMEGLKQGGVAYNKQLADLYYDWVNTESNKADHGWWGHWPYSHPEMSIDKATVIEASKTADTAVVVIGRAAGEDRENTLTKGSYYLTDKEIDMLDAVTDIFSKTVVLLNVGSIIDMSWTKKYGDKIAAILMVWQGGMESGNAAADVLYGQCNPCGALSDTIAQSYEDYPSSANFGGTEYNDYAEGIYVGYRYFDRHKDKVLYPFGYGLSYTEFAIEPLSCLLDNENIKETVSVKNIGKYSGKKILLMWCKAPSAGIDKPERVLVAFAKTKQLEPGESENIELMCSLKEISSFDEAMNSFVIEAGDYEFMVNDKSAGVLKLDYSIIEKCDNICISSDELKQRILERMPQELAGKPAKSNKLEDVSNGKVSLDDFILSLDNKQLEALTRGEGGMNSSLGVEGNAGAFGGVIESLRNRGVNPIITSDGPSGIRIKRYTSLMPSGTAIACSFDTELAEKMYAKIGEEMLHFGVDVLLAPGMNIHRNPLCGRNFEYYSEDPLLAGKMAAAVVRGVQSTGRAACPKHYACNNQEVSRNTNDSRVSQRALREIYLRSFEIVVKEAKPLTIMTSYNKVNGVWSHYNYDLVTTVLRNEWGFEGVVMTDWWMKSSKSPEFPIIRNNAYRVRAQVDVYMPGDDSYIAKRYKADKTLLESFGKDGGITKAELQRTAKNVLKLVLRLKYNNYDDKRVL